MIFKELFKLEYWGFSYENVSFCFIVFSFSSDHLIQNCTNEKL